MAGPKPNIRITFKNKGYNVTYTGGEGVNEFLNPLKEVSNYEYEVRLNEEKRNILILKNEYLPVFLTDTKNIMTYDESSQFIDKKTKRGYNPNLK